MPGDADTPFERTQSASGRCADVAVVGGGPAGAAAAIFTARYGLDTVVFDRGRSSLKQCAHLENYPGFPAGIDVETFSALLADHLDEVGATVFEDLVESVDRRDDEGGRSAFVVETQEGSAVRAQRVVAATRYGGEYLRPLVGEEAFDSHEHGGESHEHFDRAYAADDGTTPIEGLYVASPSSAADRQAIVAGGRGARVGLAVVASVRRDAGFPDEHAAHYDWVRRDAAREDEWRDRDRWRELYDDRLPADHDLGEERRLELREREIDRRLATYRTEDAIERARERGQERLLSHLDDDLVLERAREIETARAAGEAGD